ncbi:GLS [Mytilus edulis]|uniref:GlsA n=1 Tax=Mytilus edulis TaxID=6550 RepID=A0A8S3UT29_MYTED|nr:GLS [Mytilus edulis]
MRLCGDILHDIHWWYNFMSTFNGKSFLLNTDPVTSVYTDACKTGAGGVFGTDWFYVNWKEDFPFAQTLHINEQEAFAVALAAKRWAKCWQNKRVYIYCDNSSTVGCINKCTSKNKLLMSFLRELFWLSATNNFQLVAIHLPGKHNDMADAVSRWKKNPADGRQGKRKKQNIQNLPEILSDYNKGCISNQKNPPSEEKLSSSNQEGGRTFMKVQLDFLNRTPANLNISSRFTANFAESPAGLSIIRHSKKSPNDYYKYGSQYGYCPAGVRVMFFVRNVTNTENDEYKTFSLLMAGKNGDVEALKRLYDNGVSMNMQDYDGRTALHLAVDEWKEDAMKYLIYTCNCNRHIQDRYGHTADDTLTKDTDRLELFEENHKEKEEHITEEKHSCEENEKEDLQNEKG